ncbi:MAG: sigma 54-interacting transcriptional regulator [Terracidiphilus sp.]|nr:sigma 54-interacting transcriptional regulator [Terracidiphilus sp.]
MGLSRDTYQTLLELPRAFSNQPDLQSVLQNLYLLLKNIVPCDSVAVLLLNEQGSSIRLGAFERGTAGPDIEVGTEGPYAGTAIAHAIHEQRPVFVPDFPSEFANYPDIREGAQSSTLSSGYMLPLSTSRKKLGVLCFGRKQKAELPASALSLMTAIADSIAFALENSLDRDAAEAYQKTLLEERDRWKLLLEINNHIVTHLRTADLFDAVSSSLRRYFASDFVGIWMLDKTHRSLECAVLDFPGGRVYRDSPGVLHARLSDPDLDRIRRNETRLLTREEFLQSDPSSAVLLEREGIESLALAPLNTVNGPLGVVTLGSRRERYFKYTDCDLLKQICSQISLALDNALAHEHLNTLKDKLEEERLYLESEVCDQYDFEDIIGKSQSLREVLQKVTIVAPTDSTVLLQGETGTGKELIARAIHNLSQRKARTFVRLNCAALPAGLVESELFGYEKGAFTGAIAQKKGRFEIADQGTLFLDEIGDIPLDLQPKLLRALQEREFERLGSTRTIGVNVRLIAATHRDLWSMIEQHEFREDLFYRLNVFPIIIPPLRERRDDIPLLVSYFVSRLARRMRKNISSIPKHAMEALTESPWPGNIRELENFIERAVILSQGNTLNVPINELKRRPVSINAPAANTPAATPLMTFADSEKDAIVAALKASSWKISGPGGAAERLGLKRTTLQNKMHKLGISRKYS